MLSSEQKAWLGTFLGKDATPAGLADGTQAGGQAPDGAGAGDKSAAGAGTAAASALTRSATGPETDRLAIAPVIPLIIGGVKTLLGELICRVTIQNNTGKTLTLDGSSTGKFISGAIDGALPKAKLAPNGDTTTFVAHSTGITIPILNIGLSADHVDGVIRYFVGDDKTVWSCRFENPRTLTDPLGSNKSTTKVDGPSAGKLDAQGPQPEHGADVKFFYALSEKGGPTPVTPTPGAGGAQTSCLVTVVNQTKATLFLRKTDKASGDYMTQPATSLAPGASTQFAFIQTPGKAEPELRGLMTWEVGDPKTATWDLMWDNPTGEKNYTAAFLKPDNTGLHSLDQIGQGDENVPVTFTLSGGGGGGPTPPDGTAGSCDITIINNTQAVLSLSGRKTGSGVFATDPPTKIAAGATVKVSYTSAPNSPDTGCVGALDYTIGGDAAAEWAIDWNNPAGQANTCNDIVAPASAGYKSESSIGPGDQKVPVSFILSGCSQPKPTPGGKMTMTVENKTDQPLTFLGSHSDRGAIKTSLPKTLAAQSTLAVEADDTGDGKGVNGAISWTIGAAGGGVWVFNWDHAKGQAPTAGATVDPPQSGFKSTETATAQGDDDATATFTLSGGTAPVVDEEFAPPPKSKQPTLRKGDTSPDGWVEYAQRMMKKNKIDQEVNGTFDGAMAKKIHDYQAAHNLQADGVIGNQTWSSLREADVIETVGTDGRKPHTFEEKGAQARFVDEKPDASGYRAKDDFYWIYIVSTGEQAIEKNKATIKITQKNGKAHTHSFEIGDVVEASPDGQGNFHAVRVSNFTQAFAIEDPATIADCMVDAYLDAAIGGDRFTGPIRVTT